MTEAKSPNSAWTDEALQSGKDDTLGRLPYAQRAAQLIHTTHSLESSAVFGLSGPWGSGKTSLVNLIVEALQEEHSGWAVARFTPWATSDIPGLLAEFYSSLSEVLPKKRGEQVRKALAVTASVAAPAAQLIPLAGGAAVEVVRMASEALAKSPSWQTAFDKASAELKDLNKPILVVVDDIDRLHVDELMALLKVVRLLGRFNGVQYLLAYDDETLHRSMTASSAVTSHDGSAERFMEKIVQYPLFVPPLLRHQQITRLNSGLAKIARERVDGGGASHRLSGLLDCFIDLLTTPRAIDRYIAQVQHHIPLLPPDEVDDEDVELLTLIRVSFPALFNSLPRYRRELVSGHTGEFNYDSRPFEYVPFDIEPLIDVVPIERRAAARELLVALFPKVGAKGRISVNGSQRRQSVQHEEYFDRYFAMGIPDHDVSDAVVAAAVISAISGEAGSLKKLLVGTSDEFRGLVLTKCVTPSNQPTTDTGRLKLVEVLAGLANDLPADDSGPFSDLDQVLGWVGDTLVGIDMETPAETVREVLWRLDGPALRIRGWRRVESSIERVYRSSTPPPWFDHVTAALVEDAFDNFLEHLKQGDDAPEGSGVGYQVQFLLRYEGNRLRDAVRTLIESGEVHISVLASRLTSARTPAGITPDWQLSPDFDQETFNQLAPPGDHPWYDELVQDVDTRDLSWANRRRFAAGRVRQPPQPLESGEEEGDGGPAVGAAAPTDAESEPANNTDETLEPS